MPIEEIAERLLENLDDQQPHDFDEVIQQTAEQTSSYPADVKSAILSLLRRQKLHMTDDFKVQISDEA
jgi:hypothetical protein